MKELHRFGRITDFDMTTTSVEQWTCWPDPNRRSGMSSLRRMTVSKKVSVLVALRLFQRGNFVFGRPSEVKWRGKVWRVLEIKPHDMWTIWISLELAA